MSLSTGFHFDHRQFRFSGYSIAGTSTSLVFKNAKFCFDVGQGLPFQLLAEHFFISHGHLDHAAGIPWVVSQRSMRGLTSNFYVPKSLVVPLTKIMETWEEVEQYKFNYHLQALEAPIEIDSFLIKPFKTFHRIDSQGYLVYENKKRLKSEYQNFSQNQIREIYKSGQSPSEHFFSPVFGFTGDTQIEFLKSDPDLANAKILFVEATFWDDKKTIEHARQWGHLHVDEIIQSLDRLHNEKIVLIHTSARYSKKDLDQFLEQKLSPQLQDRVLLFPRD